MKKLFSIISWLLGLVVLRGLLLGANTQKARVTFRIVDEFGTRATMALYMLIDPATTLANLTATKTALKNLVANACLGGVTETDISLVYPENGSADDGSKVEQTAVFDFLVPESGRQYGIALPAVKDTLLLAGGAPDLSAGAISDLTDALSGALTGGATGEMTSNDFQPLGDLHDAFLSFRERRKSLARSSAVIPAP